MPPALPIHPTTTRHMTATRAVLLGAFVQHVPPRAELLNALDGLLRAPGMPVRVVPDPGWGDGPPNPWRGYSACLRAALDDGVTHAIVVQDDAVPCARFGEAARLTAAARPDALIVYFVPGKLHLHCRAIWSAADEGRNWAPLLNQYWCPVVATCWPRQMIEDCLRFAEGQPWSAQNIADDEVVGRYLRWAGQTALATVPSLVEHPDDVVSLVGKKAANGEDPGRTAACMISADCDATGIDWTMA